MLGRSPDVGDTLIYRAWFELSKEAVDEDPNKNAAQSVQWGRFEANAAARHLNSTK